jgi:hypothetical protein
LFSDLLVVLFLLIQPYFWSAIITPKTIGIALTTITAIITTRMIATTSPTVNELGVGVPEGVGAEDIVGSIVVIGSSVTDCVGKMVVVILAYVMEDSFTQYLAMNVVFVDDSPPSLHPIALPLMASPGVMNKDSVCTPPVVLTLPVWMPYIAKWMSLTVRNTLVPLGKPMFTRGSIPSEPIDQEQKARICSPLLPCPFKQNKRVLWLSAAGTVKLTPIQGADMSRSKTVIAKGQVGNSIRP